MKTYTVTIHEHVGREYTVQADSEAEAYDAANDLYATDDGDVTYSEVDSVEITEGKPLGLTRDAAVPA